jgi:hypothetical protein
MKYIYLLLLILVLYYLFLNIYQKYSNQEDFDPSLVPVSSIVTLAKVAQKLVDGGGTLTNPGNLQIGLPSTGALGNLYVTGTNKVDGNTTIKGTTTIDSLLTANGGISTTTIGATDNISANSFSTTNGNVSINNGTINLTSDGTGGLYFLRSGTPGAPVYNRLYMGNTNVTGDFSASGNAQIVGNTTISGESTGAVLAARNGTNGNTYKFIPGGSKSEGGVDAHALNLYAYGRTGAQPIAVFNDDGNSIFRGDVIFNKNVNVSDKLTAKQICIGSTCIEERHLQMLTGQYSIQFARSSCNQHDPSGACGGGAISENGGGQCIDVGTGRTPGCGTSYASFVMTPFSHAKGF